MRQLPRFCVASLSSAFCLGLIVSCGGGGGSTTTTSTSPTQPTQAGPASGSEFLYAVGATGPIDGGNGEIYVSSLNPTTGQLTEPIDVTPANLPVSMLVQLPPVSNGKNLYIPGYNNPSFTAAIFPFSITGSQGQLTAPSNYPVDYGGPTQATGFLIDGLGRFLYTNYYMGNDQYVTAAFPIDQRTGNIIQGEVYVQSNFVGSLVLQAADKAGKFLYGYAWTPAGPEIVVYSINANTGAVVEATGSPYPVNDQGNNAHLFFSPSGKLLYIYGTATDQSNLTWPALYIYSVDSATGKPTPTTISPIIMRNANGFPAFSPTGNLMYMPERFVDNEGNVSFDIGVFQVNQADGSISTSSVSSVTTVCHNFQPDPSGKILLIGPCGSNYVTFWSYLVDDSTGALTPAKGSPFFANDPDTIPQFYAVVRIP